MKQTKKNEELQSRREFFKSAAKGALPILALTVLGPAIFSSCEKDDDDDKSCRGGCADTCISTCDVDCGSSCHDFCANGCSGGCSGTSIGGRR